MYQPRVISNSSVEKILARIPEGLFAFDENDQLVFLNPFAEKFLEGSRKSLIGLSVRFCFPQPISDSLIRQYYKVKISQGSQSEEIYLSEGNRWVEVSMHPGEDGITCITREISHQKEMEREMEERANKYKVRITSAVIHAQERERALVGIQLHDNVAQVLATVKLYTELAAEGAGNKELMLNARSLLQHCIEDIRTLSQTLSAPTLGKIELKDSIADLIGTINAADSIHIELKVGDLDGWDRILDHHLAIYRILQEHLINITRHSRAKNVSILIQKKGDEIVLRIQDDGEGFDLVKEKKGNGINNMISRAESLGGRFTINSAPGLGCVLIVQWPV